MTYPNTNPQDQQYGAICEQGDLGLGFDVFNEQEQKTIKEQNEKDK